MSIYRRYAVHRMIIKRYRDIAGTQRESLSATATVEVALQTLSVEARSQVGIGIDEKAFVAWDDVESVITEGDHIYPVDPDDEHYGMEFVVREVTVRDYGINQHTQLLLTEYNE